ncbi:POK9 protein, partial [Nyctibius grandis]|nr:POK9 protein [Nyctibius grandis]
SAGLDLAAAATITFTDSTVQRIPTGVWGPLGHGHSALLLGRSSTTLMGLFVLPGVIDADFKGEIQIMAWTPSPPCVVQQGTRVAQLILFKAINVGTSTKERGSAGFGSSGPPQVFWATPVTSQRPYCKCMLTCQGENVELTGLLDTGADVTVIS